MSQRPLNEHGGTATRIGVRLTHEQDRRLRAVARRRHVTVSELLRRFADEGLARVETASVATGPPSRGG